MAPPGSPGYSTREVSSLLGIPPARVRALARAGLAPDRRGGASYRFSFQDVVLLRTAASLIASGVPMKRLRRSLESLAEQLPRGRSLSGVRIVLDRGELVVSEGGRSWEPISGQGVLDFEVADLARAAAPFAPRLLNEARPAGDAAAEDWFELGVELEATSPPEAREAYERALAADPALAAAHLNLGRLLHEDGEIVAAEARYRRALALDPGEPIAAFNLGVALEDQARLEDARAAYERALDTDPSHADAWYNLAGVLERLGETVAAFRCLKRYRELIGTGAG